jgi:hypothetical protein
MRSGRHRGESIERRECRPVTHALARYGRRVIRASPPAAAVWCVVGALVGVDELVVTSRLPFDEVVTVSCIHRVPILSPASSVLLLGGSMTSRRLYWFSDRMKTVPRNSGGARPAERAAATGALSGATPLFTAASTVIYTFEISSTRAAQRIQYKQLGTRYCTGKYS